MIGPTRPLRLVIQPPRHPRDVDALFGGDVRLEVDVDRDLDLVYEPKHGFLTKIGDVELQYDDRRRIVGLRRVKS